MRRVTAANGAVYYASPLLEAEGVRHAFSTRIGGVSAGAFATLNMGNPLGCPEPDSERNIEENHRRLAEAAALPWERTSARQVHGASVLICGPGDARGPQVEADAIVSSDPGRSVAIRVADCAAVLISSAGGGTIAAVHAGWRGAVMGVVNAAVESMRGLGAPPVAAAVFPCISMEAFEVGPEVVEAFRAAMGPDAPARFVAGGKGRAGVGEACEFQLRRAGINRVEVSGACTFGDADEFFSHRRATRDNRGITGRMVLLAAPSGAGGRS
jgi:YfiH family protein